MPNLAHRFRHLRKTRTLTQEDLAAKAKVARTTVNAVERGENIGLPYLRQLATALNLSETEWLNLLVDWIALQLGSDFARLSISTGYGSREQSSPQLTALRAWVETLSPSQSEILLKATRHPGLWDLLRAAMKTLPTVPKNR